MNTLQSSTCLLLCTTVLSGCDPPLPKKSNAQSGATPVEQAADWPEGTVIVVGNEPILASEIENWADTIALVEPSHTRPDHLRKALTNLVLHKKVARQILQKNANALARRQYVLWKTFEVVVVSPRKGPR